VTDVVREAAGMASARRVVTGRDAAGGSGVTLDSAVDSVAFGGPGTPHLSVLWELVADGGRWASTDPHGGYSQLPAPGTLRLVQLVLPPHSAETLAVPMHRTPTVDLLFVAQGVADVVLEEGPTTLRAGDYLVMHGDVHGWRNRGDVDCVLIAAMAGSG
jgi:mannose-6-phosphate isomerase-like protein (cupin superfamily)